MLGWSVPKECPVQNEVNGNQFVQKVGRVDAGSLLWEYVQEFNAFRFASNNKKYLNYGIKQNTKLYLDGFNYIGVLSVWAEIQYADEKSIACVWAGGTDDGFVIKSTTYTDATAFKSAMQGKYLYYELATPITTTIDGNEIGETVSDVRKETTVNLLKPTLETTTLNGVTCTNNGDGTYTVDGIATADVHFTIAGLTLTGTYKILGAPKSEDVNKFYVGGNNVYHAPYSGAVYTYDNTTIQYDIAVTSGITVNKELVKPMITTNLSATYDDFVPYTGDTGSLNGDVSELKNDVNGLKNEKAPKTNPVFTGSFSMGRMRGSDVGKNSMAEGVNTIASGLYSHAEGNGTKASGASSHAEGLSTIAAGKEQHVEGKYNVQDTENKYAHIIGGGTSSTKRRNIHTVDWKGNAYYAGDVTTASKSLNKAPQLIYTLKIGNTDASETIDVTNNYGPTHQYLYTINAFGNDGYEVGLVMYIHSAYKFIPLASSNTSKTLGDSTTISSITISFSTSEPGPHFSITRSGNSYGSTCNIYQLS